jgi:hypothetical protein
MFKFSVSQNKDKNPLELKGHKPYLASPNLFPMPCLLEGAFNTKSFRGGNL